MRKALIPMLASLALCGAATTAMVMSTAHAQPAAPHEPMMVAQADAPPAPPRGQRGFNRPAPADMAARLKDMCDNSVARESGRLAFLETKLDLTSSEEPLFQRYKDAVLSVAHRRATQCNTQISQRMAERQSAQTQGQTEQRPTRDQRAANRPGPAERMAKEEDRLKQRLADIQSERPALDALTNALSPAQKTELARGTEQRRDMARNMMRRRFAEGPRGPMGPGGPMGQGGMGPGGMGPGGPQGGPPLER